MKNVNNTVIKIEVIIFSGKVTSKDRKTLNARATINYFHRNKQFYIIGSVTSLYDPVCLSIRRSVGQSVKISKKGGRLQFHAIIGVVF